MALETLELAQESRDKMKQMNKEIKPANYTKINHLSGVFVPQTALSREELYFSNNSKTANVSKSFSIPNEDLSDDTTPSVARKFLNEIKSTIVTLQHVVKQRMTIETHNWASSAHQELHKIEAAKFVGDFKSLAKEADDSLAKHKALELEIERLLKAVFSQDIISVVQNTSVVDTSALQTELERTIERFKNCIIKKENEYAKLWNDWYKKCDECKYDKISYDKAYKDMRQKIQRLQAQLGDLKDNTQDSSDNTKFAKQPIVENLSKVDETNALSKPVNSNSVSSPQESKSVNNDKVIAPGMLRINPDKTSREVKNVPNSVRASNRTKPITVSQPPVFTRKDVNSNLNGLSSTGVANTKTRRPHSRSNTKNDRVPSVSKSSRSQNKEAEVEEHHRNLLLSKNNKHMSSACNNIKLDSQDVIFNVICTKQKAKVSVNEIQKKYQPKVTKPKKVGTLERLATPKPRKPRFLLRWSPTGRLFDQEGKLVASSKSESQYDCSNGDNACTSNAMEPKIKRNDHVAAILGFGDLQWGNILITRVYFVEGLGHNLFSVGQFCDSDLEVAFRRNACFGRNLEGVDLLKGDRYQNPFYLKQAQKKQQSLYDGKVLLEKHDPPVVHDSEETLQLAQESRDKMKQMNKEIKPANYTKINHLSGEAAKFVGDFKSLAKEADDSLAKHKALELEIERLLRAVCDECKYDKISYDKAYKDMHQKIERLQAQLGDLKGKSKDTSSVSDTRNPLSQKLENENVELEFQVLNYARENAHLKATYKNLFDSIYVSRIDNIKTRRPQPRSNTKNDRVPSASKSSRSQNKEAEVEEHHRNLLLSKNNKHISSASAILGFGDLQWGNILITRVYFVEGLGHNLFSVGQFCDSDLDVAFKRDACFVRNLKGVDLLKGDHSTNLYTINLHEMASASPICLMARASSTKSWLCD
nr:integrase, catalytic region, zinc finger, CCHC-type, peptidase aspartic, catalytic [Tanacetum cinerariifolium]